jgi:serine/threonine-protein kinase HipA
MKCIIQIFLQGQWVNIAKFTPDDEQVSQGYAACGGLLEYDDQYVINYFSSNENWLYPPVSLQIPVDFNVDRYKEWPAFFLDLVPTGAGRRGWIDRLNLKDNRSADWDLLINGARHPVGWLRVIGDQAISSGNQDDLDHEGFSREEVALREESFLEYAIERGAAVTGSSDVQGESPKLLITEDKNGRLHADGALPDHRARQHWLIKFARKRDDIERMILRNEAAYLKLANEAHLNVHAPRLIELFNNKALFIPRFDRSCYDDKVIRFGMESFASALGNSDFGVRTSHEECCALIIKHSSAPDEDLLEYLKRDILNVCMGNTDNHSRNSAFLKKVYDHGDVRLSPLYDFAPMFLSDEGYARVTRWDNKIEYMGEPNWPAVGQYIANLENGPTRGDLAEMFAYMAKFFSQIDAYGKECGVETEVINRRRQIIENNVRLLDQTSNEVLRANN